ncbi:hypothetical protein LCGC14_0312670 [marine sediment metagenome]|uniref:Uncharacterized protein n=1 Tax=marine sediment metagenome TaxID=412755 RepID=A0A0F9TLH5_9ZZZZ
MGVNIAAFQSRSLAERFWRRVDYSGGLEACWPWKGAQDKHGYGWITIGSMLDGSRHTERCPRVAYILTHSTYSVEPSRREGSMRATPTPSGNGML